MPWKDGYTLSDERSLRDDEVRWPDGARCCVSLVVALAPPAKPSGLRSQDLATDEALFGLGEGLDRVVDLLGRHELRATFAVPAVVAPVVAERLVRLLEAGHEIAPLGFRHEDVGELGEEEERERLEATTATFAALLGAPPQGWYSLPRPTDRFAVGSLSARTLDLLIDAGYRYFGNGLSDDLPHYVVSDFATRRCLLAMPYYYHFDDQFFLMFPRRGSGLEHADALFANCRAELAAQLERGRHFSMTLHPHAIAWAHRLQLLGDFFADLRALEGLWNATSAECASYWQATYPPEELLRLEPPIWRDYEGSLS